MGVCIEPRDAVIGLDRFEQYIYRTQPEGVRSGPGDLDPECIAMADPWRRLLRIAAECKINRDDLLRDHRDLTMHDIIRSRYPGAQ